MPDKLVIHYTEKETGEAYCYGGIPERSTANLAEVNCKNCIEKRLRLSYQRPINGLDWDAIKQAWDKVAPQIIEFIEEWQKSSIFSFSAKSMDYPPSLSVVFWITADKNRKRKSVGMHISDPDAPGESNIVQVLNLTDNELVIAGDLVGSICDKFNCRAFRERQAESCTAVYTIKMKYDSFGKQRKG